MKTLFLLALVGLVSAEVLQHKLHWRPSRRMRMRANGELEAYVQYLQNLRTSNLASLPETVSISTNN